jgi:hypothetical protein
MFSFIVVKSLRKTNHMEIMKNQTLIKDEDSTKFSKIIKEKIRRGFVIEETNDKLPFAVLSKKRINVSPSMNFLFCCLTLGLWSIPWMCNCFISTREKRIIIGIDEDGNAFEDKCYN